MLPDGWTLDPLCEQVLADQGIWWVIRDDGLRTAWNGDDRVICPVCNGDRELMPDCAVCVGRGLVDHIPFAERPWDEIIPGLWLGGHDCQPAGAPPNGECFLDEADFDVVVSLYERAVWDFGWARRVPEKRYQPREGVLHHYYRMADADLDPEHHTQVDDMAELVATAVRDGRKVLVRCQAGLNRSSLIAGLALLHLGLTARDAIALMREKRSPYVLFNPSFVDYIHRKETFA